MQDVEIVLLDSREAHVITDAPLPAGERLFLEIPMGRGDVPRVACMRVTRNHVIVDDGTLRRRVHLEPVHPDGAVAFDDVLVPGDTEWPRSSSRLDRHCRIHSKERRP